MTATPPGNAVNDSGAAIPGIWPEGPVLSAQVGVGEPTEAWVIASNLTFRPERPIRRSRS